jgi:hexosaminidase
MKHVTDLLDRGFSLVLAPTSTFYLVSLTHPVISYLLTRGDDIYINADIVQDWGNGAWLDVKTDDIERYDPYMTWRHIMAFNPYTNITSTQRGQILGGQVQAWAEQTDEHNLDSQLWPRAAAACEVFWGGDRKGAYPRDAREYMRAMHDMRYRMVERGTEAKPLAPHWCAVNPGGSFC